jgi:hypothetical protein
MKNDLLMGLIFATALVFVTQSAFASKNIATVSLPGKIQNIAEAIPARGSSLAAVMRSYGLEIDSVMLSDADDADINDGSFLNKKGDRFISISLKDPVPTNPECKIMDPFSFTLRKGKYLPESRTANFLLRGKCEAPDR